MNDEWSRWGGGPAAGPTAGLGTNRRPRLHRFLVSIPKGACWTRGEEGSTGTAVLAQGVSSPYWRPMTVLASDPVEKWLIWGMTGWITFANPPDRWRCDGTTGFLSTGTEITGSNCAAWLDDGDL
jgi:hypothetical protein